MRLDRHALGGHVGVGAQVERGVRGQDDGLQEVVEALAGDRRDVDEHRVAAVLLGDEAVLGELTTNLDRVRGLLVDLVDRHHDRHVGRLGVVEGLDRLGHHTVVGRYHQDGDVGRLGTTGTHGGERLVTGGVDQGDATLLVANLGRDLVGTDGLRDAAGLARHHVGVAQRVEQLGLSVVDVTHDGDHRRARLEVVLVAEVLAELDVERLEQLAVLVLGGDDLDVVVQLGTQHLQRVVGHRLGGVDHLAQVEQHLHQRCRLDADLLGQVGQRRTTTEADLLAVTLPDADATDRRGLHLVELCATRLLALATAARLAATATERTLGAAATAATATAAADRTGRGAAAEAGTVTAAGAAGATTAGAAGATARGTRTGGAELAAGEHIGAALGHVGFGGGIDLERACAVQHMVGVDGGDGGNIAVLTRADL